MYVKASDIKNKVKTSLINMNIITTENTKNLFKQALKQETNLFAAVLLKKISENQHIAEETFTPICQDTGMVTCFLKIGRNICLDYDIYEVINDAVKEAYDEGFLRKSVVNDPIERKNTLHNTPAIFYTKIIPEDIIEIGLIAKGAGSENISLQKMLKPTDSLDIIKEFVLEAVKKGASKGCPPFTVGVGIGGDFAYCTVLAKEALLEESESPLGNELKELINKTNIGPLGLKGNTTCFNVFVKKYPCHIASLPVAVNITCHVNRHDLITIRGEK